MAPTHTREILRALGPVESWREHFLRFVEKSDACWTWTGAKAIDRYGRYGGFQAHRVMFALEHGEPPRGAFVTHDCDNRPCVNPAHLRLGDYQSNVADRRARGRMQRGNWRTGIHWPDGRYLPPCPSRIPRTRLLFDELGRRR